MKRRMLAGYLIETQLASAIPHVTLERMGSKDRGYLTPDEARQLAEALIKCANAAEST